MKRILSEKNKMTKLIALMMALMMSMMALASCGGGGSEEPAENADTITINMQFANAEDENTTINFPLVFHRDAANA